MGEDRGIHPWCSRYYHIIDTLLGEHQNEKEVFLAKNKNLVFRLGIIMYVTVSNLLAVEREEARKRKYNDEFLKRKLGKVYKLFELSKETANLFKGEYERYLGLLFSNKSSLKIYLTTEKGIEKRIWSSSPLSTAFKVLVYSLHFSAKNNLLEKPMDIDRFRGEITKYDSDLYRGNVTSTLRRRWVRENIFKVEGNNIILMHPLREVLVV